MFSLYRSKTILSILRGLIFSSLEFSFRWLFFEVKGKLLIIFKVLSNFLKVRSLPRTCGQTCQFFWNWTSKNIPDRQQCVHFRISNFQSFLLGAISFLKIMLENVGILPHLASTPPACELASGQPPSPFYNSAAVLQNFFLSGCSPIRFFKALAQKLWCASMWFMQIAR